MDNFCGGDCRCRCRADGAVRRGDFSQIGYRDYTPGGGCHARSSAIQGTQGASDADRATLNAIVNHFRLSNFQVTHLLGWTPSAPSLLYELLYGTLKSPEDGDPGAR
jgi:hypothetical protein